jgi:hypothetical protein
VRICVRTDTPLFRFLARSNGLIQFGSSLTEPGEFSSQAYVLALTFVQLALWSPDASALKPYFGSGDYKTKQSEKLSHQSEEGDLTTALLHK